jgi:DNA polymerase-3 subunit gamma/tau
LFENIIGQPLTERLRADITNNTLPPAMLFSGPSASGKGTAALELGRAFSCETADAPWNCRCRACARHRALSHDDLLMTGPREFSAEIAASRSVFLREPESASSRVLFFRAVRKLLLRFSPVLWADDPKITKLNATLEAVNDAMEELNLLRDAEETDAAKLAKHSEAVIKHTLKLEADGIAGTIPVSHIRNAAYWLRGTPGGKRKLLVIENADCMQDVARNSLLKILEEPPETCAIVLCSAKPEALLPTILSRLRSYMFVKRDASVDADIIRRVFKADEKDIPAHDKSENGITAYLGTFLPVPKEKLYPAAALFWAAAASSAYVTLRAKNAALASRIAAIGTYCSAIAERAGLGKAERARPCASVLDAAANFTSRGVFDMFLILLGTILREALQSAPETGADAAFRAACRRSLSACADAARVASDIFKQSPALVLESLMFSLRNSLASL